MTQKPLVIILHGIFRTALSMGMVDLYLRSRGYDVLNLTYPSSRHDLPALANLVAARIETTPKFKNASEVHFVTHSMGGLVTRYMLNTQPEIRTKTRNIVMMVPPNQGSETADFIVSRTWMNRIYSYFSGPVGPQLTTAYAASYPEIDGNIGIIAGTRSSNPLSRFVFTDGRPHDGTISHERMRLSGIDSMIAVPASHTSIVCSFPALRQTAHFLQTGSFMSQS